MMRRTGRCYFTLRMSRCTWGILFSIALGRFSMAPMAILSCLSH